MTDPVQHTERLAQLVHAKLEVLAGLRDLSRRQVDLVDAQEMDQLMSVLAAKNSLVAHLQRLERALRPYRAEDPELRVWSSQTRRAETRAEAERCGSLLQEVLLLDRQCEVQLETRLNVTNQRLQGVRASTLASRAYREELPAGGQHLDLTSEG